MLSVPLFMWKSQKEVCDEWMEIVFGCVDRNDAIGQYMCVCVFVYVCVCVFCKCANASNTDLNLPAKQNSTDKLS
jgi:hypothetical protein